MRFLRYFALFVLALLSINIVAQDKKETKTIKVTIKYEFGELAGDHYRRARNATVLYTFSSSHTPENELAFLKTRQYNVELGSGKFLNMIRLGEHKFEQKDYFDGKGKKLGEEVGYTIDVNPGATSYIIFCNHKDLMQAVVGLYIIDDENNVSDEIKDQAVIGSLGKIGKVFKSEPINWSIEEKLVDEVYIIKPGFTKKGGFNTPAEKPGVLIMSKNFTFPYKLKPNQRVVAQPIWYDRVDISDANNDTVFAYGKPVYLDYNEYALTQDRAMDYKMSKDKLYAYTDTLSYYKYPVVNDSRLDSLWNIVCNKLKVATVVPDTTDNLLKVFPKDTASFSREKWLSCLDKKEFKDSLKGIYQDFLFSFSPKTDSSIVALQKHLTDSLQTKITLSEKHDTINVYVYEELRGHNDSISHPYPQGIKLYIEDYNRVLKEFSEKDDGERKKPFKFLDFAFSKFLPDAEEFHMEMRAKEFNDSSEVRLQFDEGKATLKQDDPRNDIEKKRLELLFNSYLGSKKNLETVVITAFASPDGSVESNKDLARRRAMTAKALINTSAYTSVSSEVAPWDSVVSLLRRDNMNEIADDVQSVIDAYPGKLQMQSSEMRKKHYYYDDAFLKCLEALRTVKFRLQGTTIGQQPNHLIIENYRNGLCDDFTRAEYWVLLNELNEGEEYHQVAKLAYEKTCNPFRYTNHNGYWAYAAVHYAAANIANGIYDHSILSPFLDMEKSGIIKLEKDSFAITPGSDDEHLYLVNKRDFSTVFEADGNNAYKAVLRVYGSKNTINDVLRLSVNDYNKIVSLIGSNAVNGTKFNLLDGKNDTLGIECDKDILKLTRKFYAPEKIDTIGMAGQYVPNSPKKHERDDKTDNLLYLNQIEVIANQLVMTIREPEPYWSKYLYLLVAVLEYLMEERNEEITSRGEKAEYERLLAVANCHIGNYAGSDPKSVRLREIVASTSLKNKVIINIAMDDPMIKGGKELDIAYETAKQLPDTCVESNYLRAIILARMGKANDAYNSLAKSFSGNLGMIHTASNDLDFLSGVSESDVVNGALLKWEKQQVERLFKGDTAAKKLISSSYEKDECWNYIASKKESVASTIADHAFLNYIIAVEKESDVEKARLSMYKAFLLDKEYYNVVAVRMKGLQKGLAKKENAIKRALFNKLKAIRSSYSEAEKNKNADATYMQALNEVNALKKNNK